MNIILQNSHSRPRPTRQVRTRGKSYRVNLEDLLAENQLDTCMVKWCEHRREDGAELHLWSAKGKEHAREKAQQMGHPDPFFVVKTTKENQHVKRT